MPNWRRYCDLHGIQFISCLNLSGTQVSDVSALAQLSNLQELYLSSTQVSDVSALRKMLPKLMITS